MRITELMKELYRLKCEYGDIEVTCTGSTLPDGHGGAIPGVFETTVENLVVCSDGDLGRRVRLYL